MRHRLRETVATLSERKNPSSEISILALSDERTLAEDWLVRRQRLAVSQTVPEQHRLGRRARPAPTSTRRGHGVVCGGHCEMAGEHIGRSPRH